MMRKGFAKAMVAMLILAGASAALSVGNTTGGAGKDVSSAAHAISNSAEKNK
jgi:predicted small secreted protein